MVQFEARCHGSMKATVLAILALVAVASATPLTTEQKMADKEFLGRQKIVLELFMNIFQPSFDQGITKLSTTFNFEEHKSKFEPVYYDQFMKYYHSGFYPRGEVFSVAHEKQAEEAQALFYMLYTATDFATFSQFAAWARQHFNEQMFVYAFTVAVLHRADTRGMYLPAPYEINPKLFFSSEVFNKAVYMRLRGEELDAARLKYMNIEKFNDETYFFYSNYSGWFITYNEEQKMSYFTEDVGLNAYNYYFHVDYPEWMDGDVFGLNKDRRGELQYYFYQQILARYYLERLSNDLSEIPNFSWRQPIETGYFPSLSYQNGLDFPQRPNGYQFYEKFEEIREVEDYERRIRDIITLGYIVMPDGSYLYLKQKDFFNEFASAVFRNADSPNYYFYKSFLWIARDLLGASFDVSNSYFSAPSALENYETALRDPVFYQLYKRVMVYFFEYKKAFYVPYTPEELTFAGVNIKDVVVDKLVTFFDYFNVDLYNGLYWNKETFKQFKYDYYVRQLRLNHQPFTVKINVDTDKTTDAVVRIFIGPKYDSYGRVIDLEENRINFFELDIFRYNLKAGHNVIERKSEEFFRVVEDKAETYEYYQTVLGALEGKGQLYLNNTQAHFGFPSRLLLPKGKKGGMEYQLYVIVTPYHAPEKAYGADFDETVWSGVGTGARYIDSLPLGFPFDRVIKTDFNYPNMYFKDVIIFHKTQYELNRPYYYKHIKE